MRMLKCLNHDQGKSGLAIGPVKMNGSNSILRAASAFSAGSLEPIGQLKRCSVVAPGPSPETESSGQNMDIIKASTDNNRIPDCDLACGQNVHFFSGPAMRGGLIPTIESGQTRMVRRSGRVIFLCINFS